MSLEIINRLASDIGFADFPPVAPNVNVPTNANSAFMANRAMGDWAEDQAHRFVKRAGYVAVSYGDNNLLDAGDEGFREMFLRNREIQNQYGKRPDLLVFDPDVARSLGVPADLRDRTPEEQGEVVSHALAGIEVRSSKFRAARYHEVRAAKLPEGEDKRRYQSFTPKVEDLPAILKWVRTYEVPHVFMQVFFDEAYALSYLDILRILHARDSIDWRRRGDIPDTKDGFPTRLLRAVESKKPRNSDFKDTNMIPVAFGRKVAAIQAWKKPHKPKFKTKLRVTQLGRVDAFVRPEGGRFDLVEGAMEAVVRESQW